VISHNESSPKGNSLSPDVIPFNWNNAIIGRNNRHNDRFLIAFLGKHNDSSFTNN